MSFPKNGISQTSRDIENYFDTLVEPVQVVGNGPLTSSFVWRGGSVVRFNNFELNDLSGYVVTHWIINGHSNVKSRPMPMAFMPLCPYSPKHYRILVEFSQINFSGKPIICASDNSHVLFKFPEANKGYPYFPSTGFCFLSLLQIFKPSLNVYVNGFAGLKGGHYWNKEDRMDHQKTGEIELEWILNNYKLEN
jgi:hypothetical protein